ncbi:MAG: amino acid permease [Candidatus Tectomicrobia bacterium]|uniref:Amino acid permease n=1 Tax=Tectimicrobiota bacterium TaxID=2528274 RepID=A0A932CLC5_UNCTE|nr:amino acid permease [Candidatus Tectomicrobia bacterium]
MAHQFFAKKPLSLLLKEMAGEHRLRRVLGPIQLSSLGVGAIIGTGIFVLTGIAAHDRTGPALMLSFVVAGTACIFAALCYAEFASMAPVAGSAYTYAYATLGELFAWIIGWDLVLEYAVGASTVAHGWSHYFQDFIGIFGLKLPHILTNAPFDYDIATGMLVSTGTVLDLPAVAIAAIVTVILVKGIKESASFNAGMVIVKVAIVLFVIVVGAFYINPDNWHPFAPYGMTGISFFGTTLAGQTGPSGEPLGVLAGAAIIFFAYIGFDSVSTHAEEARNPQRDVPIGIITSLVLCTVLYIAVSAVLTGMVPYNQIDINAPVSKAFERVGLPWAQFLISLGAIAGITSVLLVMMLSQPRVLLAMARDGLVPSGFFGAVHPRFCTPWKSTILTGIFVALLGGFLPLRILAELVNIGTLLAFVIVCAAVLIMRRTHPDAARPFRAPLVPLVPILGIGICLLLMFSLPAENWLRLFIWLAIGLGIYFLYGRKHSVMARYTAHEIAKHGVSPAGSLATNTRKDPVGTSKKKGSGGTSRRKDQGGSSNKKKRR